jgi:hypothetical protein
MCWHAWVFPPRFVSYQTLVIWRKISSYDTSVGRPFANSVLCKHANFSLLPNQQRADAEVSTARYSKSSCSPLAFWPSWLPCGIIGLFNLFRALYFSFKSGTPKVLTFYVVLGLVTGCMTHCGKLCKRAGTKVCNLVIGIACFLLTVSFCPLLYTPVIC